MVSSDVTPLPVAAEQERYPAIQPLLTGMEDTDRHEMTSSHCSKKSVLFGVNLILYSLKKVFCIVGFTVLMVRPINPNCYDNMLATTVFGDVISQGRKRGYFTLGCSEDSGSCSTACT
jgi:hypothetical protein